MADGTMAPPAPDVEDPTAFILTRARSEVHLLLDNLSSNPETTIPALALLSPPVDIGLPNGWIEKVCEITWPPGPGSAAAADIGDQAAQAALLIRVRDYLNSLARPASGATIAFTLMVTQEEADEEDGGAAAPSRRSLARDAYPDLEPRARRFRRHLRLINWIPLACLVLTLILSWYLAIGNAALADYSAATEAATAAQSQMAAERQAQEKAAPAQSTGGAAPKASDATGAARQAADEPVAGSEYDMAIQRQKRAEEGLRHWTFGGGDRSTASWVANVLGSGVLPVLYGFIGAAAAVVRTLSRKTRGSTLSPRDMQLGVQQLVLGAVIGACISLFVGAPDTSGHTTLFGPVTLSSSAISFVAGFGVESVFQALEALISRIFNIAPAASPGPGSAGSS